MTAPSLSKVTELLMKRIVEAKPMATNTMNKYFMLQSINHSNHELQKGEQEKTME